MFEEVDFCL
jgi:septal ring factor EnvC (AmiA/AmiB activator)